MTAQKRRLDVIAENIANRDTTRTEDGGPYHRKLSVFNEIRSQSYFDNIKRAVEKDQGRYGRYANLSRLHANQDQGEFYRQLERARVMNDGGPKGGVALTQVFEDRETPLVPVYDPNHPDADEEGYVWMPNVDTTVEMIDAMAATRSYSANIAAFEAIKGMARQALEIRGQ